jgi:hypothetical protein
LPSRCLHSISAVHLFLSRATGHRSPTPDRLVSAVPGQDAATTATGPRSGDARRAI